MCVETPGPGWINNLVWANNDEARGMLIEELLDQFTLDYVAKLKAKKQ